MPRLDADSEKQLAGRRSRGEHLLVTAWGRKVLDDERISAASDAISDILTALYGPAGHYADVQDDAGDTHWRAVWNDDALESAQELLDRSMRSYQGDAEDYTEVES